MTRSSRRWHLVLAVLYFVALALLVFWPTPVDRPVDGTLMELIRWLHRHGIPWEMLSYDKVEFAANIAMFVPFGVLVAWRLPLRWLWTTVLVAATVSFLIEAAQATLLPERFPSGLDILANTTGAAGGAILVLAARLLRPVRVHSAP